MAQTSLKLGMPSESCLDDTILVSKKITLKLTKIHKLFEDLLERI